MRKSKGEKRERTNVAGSLSKFRAEVVREGICGRSRETRGVRTQQRCKWKPIMGREVEKWRASSKLELERISPSTIFNKHETYLSCRD